MKSGRTRNAYDQYIQITEGRLNCSLRECETTTYCCAILYSLIGSRLLHVWWWPDIAVWWWWSSWSVVKIVGIGLRFDVVESLFPHKSPCIVLLVYCPISARSLIWFIWIQDSIQCDSWMIEFHCDSCSTISMDIAGADSTVCVGCPVHALHIIVRRANPGVYADHSVLYTIESWFKGALS